MKVKVAYVAPFALAAGAHVSFARLAVVTVLPLAMADSPPLTAPLSSESTHSVPADAAWNVTEAIASLSTSAYPNSEAVNTCELSSLTVTVKSAAVGRSCTEFTVIATESATSVPNSVSLTVKVSTALLSLFSWLVHVTVAIACVDVGGRSGECHGVVACSVPSAESQSVVVARENVALCVEATVIVSDE